MLKVIEKSHGRQIVLALVEMGSGLTPIGFEIEHPSVNYVRMPYGKYGIRIKSNAPVELVVHQDSAFKLHRTLDEGSVHTIERADDGSALAFHVRGEKSATVGSDAERLLTCDGSSLGEQTALFNLPTSEDNGFLVIQVRCADVTPEHGPVLPPDEFSTLLFQLNDHTAHLRALSELFSKMRPAESLVPKDELNNQTDSATGPRRLCNIAADGHIH